MVEAKSKKYRDLIDSLVQVCHSGQGQVASERARRGIWNPHITQATSRHQHAMNLLLGKLGASERETLATLLAREFEGGVFETLKALEHFQISPFEQGYEGRACHDFIGRLSGEWEWPEQ